MKVYYFSTLISQENYDNIFRFKKPGIQSRNFNKLIIKGFIENEVDITCVSNAPLNNDNYKKFFLSLKNHDNYYYFKIINIPFLRDVFLAIQLIVFFILNKGIYFIDATNFIPLVIARFLRLKYSVIVTDMPMNLYTNNLYTRFADKAISRSYSAVFLTQQMAEYYNYKNEYKIIEGISNPIVAKDNQQDRNIFMYFGTIDLLNGIDCLVECFSERFDLELYIYGDGLYREQLENKISNFKNIKYKGLISQEKLFDELVKAKFLLNPRRIDNNIVEYSFPSKLMEYMSSKIPIITTKLPCIPEEYNDYLNYFSSDDAAGFKQTIDTLIAGDYDTLKQKAIYCYEYVSQNKNAKIQISKILEIL